MILPVFGGVTPFCYPALPQGIARGNKNYSLLKYVPDEPNVPLPEKEHAFMPALMAYAMLKTEELVQFNMEKSEEFAWIGSTQPFPNTPVLSGYMDRATVTKRIPPSS